MIIGHFDNADDLLKARERRLRVRELQTLAVWSALLMFVTAFWFVAITLIVKAA